MNKKGAETTIGTIVVVILAVLVLLVVVTGFSMGWSNLWKKINIFTPAAESIDAVIVSCDATCLAQQTYAFCCEKKAVAITDSKDPEKLTCSEIEDEGYQLTCEIDCSNVVDTEACKSIQEESLKKLEKK